MSMTKEQLRKFVEVDHKDEVILVTCDNEHIFYHNAQNIIPIIWDWDNDVFISIQTNQEIVNQAGHPYQVTMVALEEIQFITAFTKIEKVISKVKEIVTDEEKLKNIMADIQRVKPSMMNNDTLRTDLNGKTYTKEAYESLKVRHVEAGELAAELDEEKK